jgi:hypothetical protein
MARRLFYQARALNHREAREEELKVFKRTQATARDAALTAGGVGSDIGDRQPLFLRDKGAALFTQGNYK